MDTIKVTLENGAVIEGTEAQITAVCAALGYSLPTYKSSTKGLLLIANMATPHIVNALLSEYRKWLDSLRGMSTPAILRHLKHGAGKDSPIIVNLAQELTKRVDKGVF
jgi:hypothetical protein